MNRVLITGASQGIGLALTQEYLRLGAEVIGTCRNPDTAHALTVLSTEFSSLSIVPLEVTDPRSLRALAERIPSQAIDILVSNAGVFDSDRRLGALDYAEWRSVLETNTIGALATIDACLSALRRAQPYPKVIGISSALGSIKNTLGGRYFYRSSKAALNMLIRSLAVDYRDAGIIFAALSPGLVDTAPTRNLDKPKISPTTSAQGLLRVISDLTLEQTGSFLRYDGGELPW
jgi:NAD(P)-dependent dehydrogenase (short-subunit alcohol dehydrogenase family)